MALTDAQWCLVEPLVEAYRPHAEICLKPAPHRRDARGREPKPSMSSSNAITPASTAGSMSSTESPIVRRSRSGRHEVGKHTGFDAMLPSDSSMFTGTRRSVREAMTFDH